MFKLSLEDSKLLLNQYNNEIENLRKNLAAVESLASLVAEQVAKMETLQTSDCIG